MSDEEIDDWPDEQVHFTDCTCEHGSDEHDWASCNVDGCDCEGGWSE